MKIKRVQAVIMFRRNFPADILSSLVRKRPPPPHFRHESIPAARQRCENGDSKNREHKKYKCVIPFAWCGSDATRGGGTEFCLLKRKSALSPLFSVCSIFCRHRCRYRTTTAPLPHRLYVITSLLLQPCPKIWYVLFTQAL